MGNFGQQWVNIVTMQKEMLLQLQIFFSLKEILDHTNIPRDD